MRVTVLICFWILILTGSFWHFTGRYLLPVEPLTPPPIAHLCTHAPANPCVHLILAWNPECPCCQFEESYLRNLAAALPANSISITFLLVGTEPREALHEWKAEDLPGTADPDADGAKARKLGIWATPGAAVIAKDGQTAFRGSLHIGRFCRENDLAFAEKALRSILAGKRPERSSTPFYGCAVPAGR